MSNLGKYVYLPSKQKALELPLRNIDIVRTRSSILDFLATLVSI